MALSIVAPVFNEAGVVAELVRRCVAAGRKTGLSFEVLIVDDASQDATPALLGQLCDDRQVRTLRLEQNAGQFGATLSGLRQARGRVVVVLDGDLQDPPELIPSLVEALEQARPRVSCAQAVKARRTDPLWFLAGRLVYRSLQRALSPRQVPSGAGSYCAMTSTLAARIGRLPSQRSNLAAVVAALGQRSVTVSYEKASRYDGHSRVGFVGLVREALSSLLLTGAVQRLLVVLAAGCALATLASAVPAAPAVATCAFLLAAAGWFARKRRTLLSESLLSEALS